MAGPQGKHMLDIVTVGERAQIAISKKTWDIYDIQPGDAMMVLGDENGQFPDIAIIKNDI